MGQTGQASVRIVREGHFRWNEKYVESDVTCTTTYIEDGGKRIIVDTPNAGEEEDFLRALGEADIDPAEIDIVVVTHHHPDHVGCLHLFPNAEYVGAHTRWRGAVHRYWKEEALALTDDVYVLKTPGHTDDSCSVIANTADGVVAAVGDMWWSLSDPKLLVVSDAEALKTNRARIVALADKIIPGHEGMRPSSEAKL